MEINKLVGLVCISIAILLPFLPSFVDDFFSSFAMTGWVIGSYSWAIILLLVGIGFLLPTSIIPMERKKFVGWIIISVAVLLFFIPGMIETADPYLGLRLVPVYIFSFAWAMTLIVVGIGFLIPSKP